MTRLNQLVQWAAVLEGSRPRLHPHKLCQRARSSCRYPTGSGQYQAVLMQSSVRFAHTCMAWLGANCPPATDLHLRDKHACWLPATGGLTPCTPAFCHGCAARTLTLQTHLGRLSSVLLCPLCQHATCLQRLVPCHPSCM